MRKNISESGFPNGLRPPSSDELVAIAHLALAMSSGSSKLCEALLSTYGLGNEAYLRADRIDGQLQPLMVELSRDSSSPTPR
jgi:hypothetical protein